MTKTEKAAIIRKLRSKGISISSGYRMPSKLKGTKTVSLAEVRRILSKCKGSLSQDIINMRRGE